MPIQTRTQSRLSRRAFHGATLAATGATILGRPARAQEMADVIVIGAGLAGLNAALNLESEGLKVIVLEAADYVGGRTRTYELPAGPMNAGGETIGPFYARVHDVVQRLGVPLIKAPPRVGTGNYVNGTLVGSADWSKSKANKTVGTERNIQPSALEFFYLSNANPLPDPGSWTDPEFAALDVTLEKYLRGRGASDEALRLIDITINALDVASGSALAYLRDIRRLQWGIAPSSDQSTRSTYGASSNDGYEFNYVKGGTQRLPEAMAAAVKGQVRLNHLVRTIDMAGNGVEVTTIDGSRFQGKYAISAVPFSVLRNIDIRPQLTGAKFDAVRNSVHQNTLRVFLEYSAPFWDDIGDPGLFTDTAIERVFARTDENGEVFVLDCWMNGESAYRMDQLPRPVVEDFIVKRMGEIRPSTKGKVKVVGSHSWVKDSASACCRHVFNAGQVGPWADIMAVPHERLHFAGEQTRSVENGMEAAAESGERAAIEIIARES